jgi:acyl-CoA dehydrogenase
MDFDFSPDQQQLKDQARRYLSDHCSSQAVRAVLDGPQSHDAALWTGLGEQGYLGAAIPDDLGGSGAGYLELCVVAEELGRAVAPVPFSSSIALAADLLLRAGTDAQKQRWLPGLASGALIGTLALAEQPGRVQAGRIASSVQRGRLSGTKHAGGRRRHRRHRHRRHA